MSTGSMPSRGRPLRPQDPQWVGTYEIVGFLGEGGMGVVFIGRGRDGALVAIKVVREELARNPEFRARFRREAESAMRVPRFCTAEVLGADPDAAAPYLVTEYIDGPTLEQVVTREGPLRRAELDQLGVSVAAALTGIHGVGVIHRDLKPANVLLSRLGPRVIDFGIASAVDAIRLTAEGQALGTPAYMAPEQLQGQPGPASDVFCWGGVMAFAATGRRPFGTGPLPEVAARITYQQPDLAGLTGPLLEIVNIAMQKDPARRPTPSQLLELLGVSGTDADPELAVRTRLEGLGLPGPAAPPSDQTRLDISTAAFGSVGAADATRPAVPPSPPQWPPADDQVSLRFGPGVQAEAGSPSPMTQAWRSGHAPGQRSHRADRRRGGRIRSLISSLVSVAIIGGVIAWLVLRGQSPDLAVTGLEVRADNAKLGCDATAHVVGTLTTNGAPGQIAYQWQRSDKQQPDAQQQLSVASGQKTASISQLWQITGRTTQTFTATLTVLNSPTMSKSASFTYSCKG